MTTKCQASSVFHLGLIHPIKKKRTSQIQPIFTFGSLWINMMFLLNQDRTELENPSLFLQVTYGVKHINRLHIEGGSGITSIQF